MVLETSAILLLAAQCAPAVAPDTLAALVYAESKNRVYAINVNGAVRQPAPPTTAAEAGRVARLHIAEGRSVDLGLGQINSGSMKWLGLDWDSVFDPCTNIRAASRVLVENYRLARAADHSPQQALRIALSLYNTGSRVRGFRNGYVARVEGSYRELNRQYFQPVSIQVAQPQMSTSQATATGENGSASISPPEVTPLPASWDVFGRVATTSAVASFNGRIQ